MFWLKEVFLDILAWLIETEFPRYLLPLEEYVEFVLATVLIIDFSDFESVVSQEVVHDIRTVIENVELEYLVVIFQKLFFIFDY